MVISFGEAGAWRPVDYQIGLSWSDSIVLKTALEGTLIRIALITPQTLT